MRALIVAVLALSLVAVAYSQSTCSTSTPTTASSGNSFANCTSCTNTTADAICTVCATGYQLNKVNSTVASCVAVNVCNSGFYAPRTTTGTSASNLTCGHFQPDNTGAIPGTTATAQSDANGECNGKNGAGRTNYTASAVSSTGAAYTTATPANSFTCIPCPANCANCDVFSSNSSNYLAANLTVAPGCNKTTTGYFLGGSVDPNTFLNSLVCSNTSSSYASTNNATNCTACTSSTNCTAGTCPTGFTYLSYGNLANVSIGGINSSLFTGLPSSVQGCYNVTYLNATYGPGASGSGSFGSRLSFAFAAVVSVAALFAF